jgi:hypothetical protein
MARQVAEGRGHKMQMLFDYLTGTEFRNCVGGFVEAFKDMQDDLENEKRATLTRWKRRERTMVRARDNITAFYGDLQGIAGRQLRDLPALSFEPLSLPPAPGSSSESLGDDEDDDSSPLVDGATDPRLTDLLHRLLPQDGAAVGNGSLYAAFERSALLQLGRSVTEADYRRCKAMLLAKDLVQRGAGRGGSLRRKTEVAK